MPTTTITHLVTIDVTEDQNAADRGFKAFCSCGWSADHWTHSSDFIGADDGDAYRSQVVAETEAKFAALDHASSMVFA